MEARKPLCKSRHHSASSPLSPRSFRHLRLGGFGLGHGLALPRPLPRDVDERLHGAAGAHRMPAATRFSSMSSRRLPRRPGLSDGIPLRRSPVAPQARVLRRWPDSGTASHFTRISRSRWSPLTRRGSRLDSSRRPLRWCAVLVTAPPDAPDRPVGRPGSGAATFVTDMFCAGSRYGTSSSTTRGRGASGGCSDNRAGTSWRTVRFPRRDPPRARHRESGLPPLAVGERHGCARERKPARDPRAGGRVESRESPQEQWILLAGSFAHEVEERLVVHDL